MSNWVDKEEKYDELYRQGRQATNLWKYITASKQAFVTNAFSDSDGYWIWLDEDHVAYDGADDCGQIHEYTIADLKDAIKTIRRKVEQ